LKSPRSEEYYSDVPVTQRILDRYLIRQYLRMLVLFLAGVILIYILVNFFEQIDKFVDKRPSGFTILEYYIYQIPSLVVLLLPVAGLLACFFSLGEMAKRNEILAVKAAGINPTRLFFPLLLLGFTASLFSFGIGEFVSPVFMRRAERIKRLRIEKKEDPEAQVRARDLSFLGADGQMYFFRFIDAQANEADGITVMQFEADTLVQRIDAEQGTYYGGSWTLKGVTIREFEGGESAVRFHEERRFLELKDSPFEFLRRRKTLEEMGAIELFQLVKVLRAAGLDVSEEFVELHVRFSFPFANLIILLLSLALSLSLRGKGRAYAFGLSIFLAFSYWGLLQGSKAMGQAGKLSPLLSAWSPNLLFLALGIFALTFVKR
jgi:lipopolysaccharide export system permease protein